MIPIVASAGADAGAAVQHDIQHYMRPGTLQLAALPPLSLYVHLPWCLKKCPYCDFNSHEQPAGPLPERRYIDARGAALVSTLVAVRSPDDPEPLIAVGRVVGQIARAPVGSNGFGFDPIMWIPEFGKTFAQLPVEVKNAHSHRRRAAQAMAALMRERWLAQP